MLKISLFDYCGSKRCARNYKVVMINGKNLKANEKLPAQISSGFVFEQMAGVLQPINSEVADCEQIKMVVAASTSWSMDSGFLTPAMNIQRYRIEAAVGPQVDK